MYCEGEGVYCEVYYEGEVCTMKENTIRCSVSEGGKDILCRRKRGEISVLQEENFLPSITSSHVT